MKVVRACCTSTATSSRARPAIFFLFDLQLGRQPLLPLALDPGLLFQPQQLSLMLAGMGQTFFKAGGQIHGPVFTLTETGPGPGQQFFGKT